MIQPGWTKVEYWLDTIKNISIDTPIIVVGTHADQFRGSKDHLKMKLQKMKGGSRIKKIFFINCKKADCVKEILPEIENMARQHLILKKLVAKYYLVIAKLLMNLSNKMMILNWKEYSQLAQRSQHSLILMTSFFHDVGVLFWFKESDKLSDLVILSPQWLSKVMSSIVSFKFKWKNGIIDHNFLPNVWKNYPEDLHPKLLTLLEKFDIVLPMTGINKGKKSIIPCMFDTQVNRIFLFKQARFDDTQHLSYNNGKIIQRIERWYRFDFHRIGFFPRLIVRLLQDTMELNLDTQYWENGFLFEQEGHSALIEYYKKTPKIL